jgi:hypothetical protein
MSRAIRPLLAVALLALASSARASSLRVVAPAQGATLRGGSYVELRWSATELPAEAEEWEAFLSVDGTYYAFRVTPHLDIDLQRFTFRVPNVDTRNARILIRAGDEQRETQFEQAGSFSIVRDSRVELAVPGLLQSGRGEAAREGDPPVLAWTDGTRDGSGITQRCSTVTPPPSLRAVATISGDAEAELVRSLNEVAAPSIVQAARFARGYRAHKPEPFITAVDLLLVCRRRNI